MLQEKKANDERLGTTPYSYKTVTREDGSKEMVPEPREQGILGRIRSMRESGMAYQRIAEKLNDERIPSKRGGCWYPATASYLAKNIVPRLAL